MEKKSAINQFPLLWINLETATRRRARMEWAIDKGGWQAKRIEAIDANDPKQRLIEIPNPFHVGTRLPGLYMQEEPDPRRRTSRLELACLASWKKLLITASQTKTYSGWYLLMEDDVGASLAEPTDWAHCLLELTEYCSKNTLAIQMAPISSKVREELSHVWHNSQGRCLAVSKHEIKSHGNGAVLVNQKAIEMLIDPLIRLAKILNSNWHPLVHPLKIRAVADKWIYGALPAGSCKVATYPHFCLDAEDSKLHIEHVQAFHKPSRDTTIKIWQRDKRLRLLKALQSWDLIQGD